MQLSDFVSLKMTDSWNLSEVKVQPSDHTNTVQMKSAGRVAVNCSFDNDLWQHYEEWCTAIDDVYEEFAADDGATSII